MKKFWKILGDIVDWTMILLCGIILFGGGAWCVWDMFLN